MNFKEEYEKNKHLVIRKETSVPGVYVLKYKREVFHKNLWNDFLRECRGLVVDENFNIISMPFTKIHNYGIEAEAPVLDPATVVEAHRKINGFMVAVTWHNNDLLVSTTGSIDSEFVKMANELIEPRREQYVILCKANPEYTMMFECVHRNDPHIVEEEEGMYLLAWRKKEWGSLVEASGIQARLYGEFLGCVGFGAFKTTVGELLEQVKTVKHEGFVFYTEDGIASKIKSPYYLTKKALMRSNFDKFLSQEGRFKLDEEFIPLYNWIYEVERERFFELDEMARREYIENWFKGK